MYSTLRLRSALVSGALSYPFAVANFIGAPEILIQTVKRLEPEEIAMKIKHFDQEVCTEVFLSELKPVLPNPEQVREPLLCHMVDTHVAFTGR